MAVSLPHVEGALPRQDRGRDSKRQAEDTQRENEDLGGRRTRPPAAKSQGVGEGAKTQEGALDPHK